MAISSLRTFLSSSASSSRACSCAVATSAALTRDPGLATTVVLSTANLGSLHCSFTQATVRELSEVMRGSQVLLRAPSRRISAELPKIMGHYL